MPRRCRIAFPGLPHHIYQRGHRQAQVFFCDADREDYLQSLRDCREVLGIKVFAYCLMDNHVHLIVDPGATAENLSRTMKCLAGRHARRLNLMHGWRGPLWESRFKCSPIQTDRYLLTCGRYIDMNPVRARMVDRAEKYRWSSYRARAGLIKRAWLDPDPSIEALASTPQRRAEIYRDLARSAHDAKELALIRGALHRNQLTGNDEFVAQVQSNSGIHVPTRLRGRPRKQGPETKQAPFGACSRGK